MKKIVSVFTILFCIIVLLSACSKAGDSSSKDKKSKVSSKSVTVTLKGDLEVDLGDDIGEIVYEIDRNKGAVFNVQTLQKYKKEKKM